MYLDLGCCLGQDLRRLYIDGVRPSQLVGLDLVADFNRLGYDLFCDADRFSFEFHALDIMEVNEEAWQPLRGRFDVIHMTSFLHIWSWEGQVKAASRISSFTKPGSVLVGSGLGSRTGGEFPNLEGTGTNYRQSEASFSKLWLEVSRMTQTKWEMSKILFKPMEASRMNMNQAWAEPDMGILYFEITRLQ